VFCGGFPLNRPRFAERSDQWTTVLGEAIGLNRILVGPVGNQQPEVREQAGRGWERFQDPRKP
jgi:hypothetical protein